MPAFNAHRGRRRAGRLDHQLGRAHAGSRAGRAPASSGYERHEQTDSRHRARRHRLRGRRTAAPDRRASELRARGRDVGQPPGELAWRSRSRTWPAPSATRRSSRRRRSRRWSPASRRSAVFCAAPHGAAAALIDSLLKAAETAGTKPRFVDISADFRFATAAAYEAVYKHPHGAPQRLAQFTCAVPEHLKKAPTPHVGASGLLLHRHPAGQRAAARARAGPSPRCSSAA